MYPSLLLFLKDSIVLYLQDNKICKMGKGTIGYGGYKVVLKKSGKRKKQSSKNAHRITLVSNFLLCCFLLSFFYARMQPLTKIKGKNGKI